MDLDLHGREWICLLKLVTYSQNSLVHECFFNMENEKVIDIRKDQ